MQVEKGKNSQKEREKEGETERDRDKQRQIKRERMCQTMFDALKCSLIHAHVFLLPVLSPKDPLDLILIFSSPELKPMFASN